jgi:GH24 family phage-related lysozyme (muramidase)
MGPGTVPFAYDSGEQAFPRSWVYKRIVDGDFDNIATKFRLFSDPAFWENAQTDGDIMPLHGNTNE